MVLVRELSLIWLYYLVRFVYGSKQIGFGGRFHFYLDLEYREPGTLMALDNTRKFPEPLASNFLGKYTS